MLKTILHTIRAQKLIPAGTTLLVGVSGGADSLALLHLLHELAPTLDCRLHVATFDHGLRGADGTADARFVAETAAAWGVPVITGAGDARALAQQAKLSIEAAARRARYDFLAAAARQIGAERVAVAHHADDQAETVLLHLLRGAGIGGLAGMAAQSPLPGHPDLTLIRPLLGVSRANIEAYCRNHDLHPREDATNSDVTYLRNRLRRETLPYLHTLNPQIVSVLGQLADIAAVENRFMESQLQAALHHTTEVTADRVHLQRAAFAALHPALQRRLVAWAVEQIAGSKQDVAYVHILAAVEVARRGRLGAVAELPGGLHLRVDYTAYVIERADAPQPETAWPLLDSDEEIPVAIPGVTRFAPRWALVASLESPGTTPPLHTMERESWGEVSVAPLPEGEGQGVRAALVIPPGSRVTLRPRRAGDRFAPTGLNGHTQKISRWLVNQKIPQQMRDRLPVLAVDGTPAAFVVGERWVVSEPFAARPDHQHIIHFHLQQFS